MTNSNGWFPSFLTYPLSLVMSSSVSSTMLDSESGKRGLSIHDGPNKGSGEHSVRQRIDTDDSVHGDRNKYVDVEAGSTDGDGDAVIGFTGSSSPNFPTWTPVPCTFPSSPTCSPSDYSESFTSEEHSSLNTPRMSTMPKGPVRSCMKGSRAAKAMKGSPAAKACVLENWFTDRHFDKEKKVAWPGNRYGMESVDCGGIGAGVGGGDWAGGVDSESLKDEISRYKIFDTTEMPLSIRQNP